MGRGKCWVPVAAGREERVRVRVRPKGRRWELLLVHDLAGRRIEGVWIIVCGLVVKASIRIVVSCRKERET